MILAAVGMLKEARLVAGPGVVAVAGGGQAEILEQRLNARLDGARAIISFGLGGALDPSLAVGDIVVGSEALRPRGRWLTDPDWTQRIMDKLPGARLASVHGATEMVLGVLEKAKLRGKGGAALVDMESHIAARIAKARGLPFAIVRVVSDTAGMSLPPAVRAGLKADGGMNLLGVLAALAAAPRQLPALMRVGRDADRAFKALAVAQAALGPNLGL